MSYKICYGTFPGVVNLKLLNKIKLKFINYVYDVIRIQMKIFKNNILRHGHPTVPSTLDTHRFECPL